MLANRLDKTVYVKADARARYEKVVDVVDNLRAAGVDQIGPADRAGSEERRRRRRLPVALRPQPAEAGAGGIGNKKEYRYVNGSGRIRQGPKADINMTPMIDVLLVLMIIFMVITPLTPKGLGCAGSAAAAAQASSRTSPTTRTVVIVINKDKHA